MRHTKRWILAPIVAAPLLLAACGGGSGSANEADSQPPATVEQVKGTSVHRITLSQQAATRIDLHTAAIQAAAGTPRRTVIPYSAVLYSPTGEAWAYVSEKPLTFVRHRIVVDHVQGVRAILSAGPAAGTKVATVGVAELFGTETDVGE